VEEQNDESENTSTQRTAAKANTYKEPIAICGKIVARIVCNKVLSFNLDESSTFLLVGWPTVFSFFSSLLEVGVVVVLLLLLLLDFS